MTCHHGHVLDVLPTLEAQSVDAVVTDPPYGLRFMSRRWDYDVPSVEEWQAVMRVMKPGAHLLSFGGSRTYHRVVVNIEDAGFDIRDCIMWLFGHGKPAAKTTLKPAHNPVVVAQKPGGGRAALGLHVEQCRIASGRAEGRWPANAAHDGSDDVIGLLPRDAGAAAPVHRRGADKHRNTYGSFSGNIDEGGTTFHADEGSAARFFYCGRASKADRSEGGQVNNAHPTVKPTDLMRWLCRLVTPPGGIVLDPYMGSGSTGKAAILEGFGFIGIDQDAECVDVAERRCAIAAEEHQTATAQGALEL